MAFTYILRILNSHGADDDGGGGGGELIWLLLFGAFDLSAYWHKKKDTCNIYVQSNNMHSAHTCEVPMSALCIWLPLSLFHIDNQFCVINLAFDSFLTINDSKSRITLPTLVIAFVIVLCTLLSQNNGTTSKTVRNFNSHNYHFINIINTYFISSIKNKMS